VKKLKASILLLLIGAGLVGNSFAIMPDPYIPTITDMIKDTQQGQTQQEQKTVEYIEEIKQIDNKPKEENIKVKTRKKIDTKKKKD
jgi:hypothetical protein